MRDLLGGALPSLRYEPTEKRLRIHLDGEPVDVIVDGQHRQRPITPGSKLDVVGGVGLLVSQWNTTHGWPYRAMQFRVTLHDTTEHHRSTLNSESPSSGAPSI